MPGMSIAGAWYSSGTFWSAAGVVVTLWVGIGEVAVGYLARFARQRLDFRLRTAAPLLTADGVRAGELELLHRGVKLEQPYLAEVVLAGRGRRTSRVRPSTTATRSGSTSVGRSWSFGRRRPPTRPRRRPRPRCASTGPHCSSARADRTAAAPRPHLTGGGSAHVEGARPPAQRARSPRCGGQPAAAVTGVDEVLSDAVQRTGNSPRRMLARLVSRVAQIDSSTVNGRYPRRGGACRAWAGDRQGVPLGCLTVPGGQESTGWASLRLFSPARNSPRATARFRAGRCCPEPGLPAGRARRRLPDRLREALRPAGVPAGTHRRGAPRRRPARLGQRDHLVVGPARHQRDGHLVASLPALLPGTT